MDCEDCRHLTVIGLHDTGPRCDICCACQSICSFIPIESSSSIAGGPLGLHTSRQRLDWLYCNHTYFIPGGRTGYPRVTRDAGAVSRAKTWPVICEGERSSSNIQPAPSLPSAMLRMPARTSEALITSACNVLQRQQFHGAQLTPRDLHYTTLTIARCQFHYVDRRSTSLCHVSASTVFCMVKLRRSVHEDGM